MTPMIAILISIASPAFAQSDLGSGSGEFGNDIPNLLELFRARPPMGTCPVGATDDRGPLPEGSHLLHLGVPRFYTDYRRRLGLSDEQLEALRQDQKRALEAWAKHQATIEGLEVQVWVLTGDPEFEDAELEAALRGLEKARSTQRAAYIGAVRSAAQSLTPKQRRSLIGSD